MVNASSDFSKAEEHNGITFTRLPDMPYVAVVETLDDMELWKDRKELGLRGLITTMPIPQKEREYAAQQLIASIHDSAKKSPTEIHAHINKTQIRKQAKANATSSEFPDYDIPGKIADQVPNEVRKITSVMIDTFFNTAGATMERSALLQMRVNSDFPDTPHQHLGRNAEGRVSYRNSDSMTLSLTQNGTVIYDDEPFIDNDGLIFFDEHAEVIYNPADISISHTLQAGQLILMDDTLWHSAAPPEETWEDTPRTNLIFG